MDTILKNGYFFCSYITIVFIHAHPALFVRLYSAVSSNRGVATKNKTRHCGSLMDRSIKVTRQLEKVFESYSMVIKEMKGAKK